MFVPQPFPYQGSKRRLAGQILAFVPLQMDRLIEPFAGSAAISIRAAVARRAPRFVINDINRPLIELWDAILQVPDRLANEYETLWYDQLGREKAYYAHIRDQFNATHEPHYLLYLLARCVKASVRYNARGEFNQSADNRRKGMHPDRMRKHIQHTSALLGKRTITAARDYRDVLSEATCGDLIYMDPPYQGVSASQDPRYVSSLDHDDFVEALADLNARGIAFLVSYDGRTGTKQHGKPLPSQLNLVHHELNAGRSSQATLNGQRAVTIESLYLSPVLAERVAPTPSTLQQLSLWS